MSGAAVPVPPDRPIVTPVAGPVLVLPGTAVIIIIVALVGLLFGGGVFLSRRRGTTSPQHPPK
jgi:LPS O-antigen subunit length determinant protein (WzzB/FepE family)